jgi:hypothetical protein
MVEDECAPVAASCWTCLHMWLRALFCGVNLILWRLDL